MAKRGSAEELGEATISSSSLRVEVGNSFTMYFVDEAAGKIFLWHREAIQGVPNGAVYHTYAATCKLCIDRCTCCHFHRSIAGYIFHLPLFSHPFLFLACACPARWRSTRALDSSDFSLQHSHILDGRRRRAAEHKGKPTNSIRSHV